MSLEKEREVAEQAALEAGARIRDFFKQGNAWVKEKSPNNPLTQADHEANEIIQKAITENFPGDAGVLDAPFAFNLAHHHIGNNIFTGLRGYLGARSWV